jgi:hypothetical protein
LAYAYETPLRPWRFERASRAGRLEALGVHGVEAVTQLGVVAREQVAVAVQGEAPPTD